MASTSLDIQVRETYRGIPVLEVSYDEPHLLTRESHTEQMRALVAYPAERIAVIVSYNNISCSHQYGPEEQARLYQEPEFDELHEKVLCLFRYHARSLTALVSTMSAHAIIQQGASNFAPDQDSAVRAARRAIDRHLAHEMA